MNKVYKNMQCSVQLPFFPPSSFAIIERKSFIHNEYRARERAISRLEKFSREIERKYPGTGIDLM